MARCLSFFIEKYYDKLSRASRYLCKSAGMASFSDDLLHDCLLSIIARANDNTIQQCVLDELNGDPHFYHLCLLKIKRTIASRLRTKRVTFDIASQFDEAEMLSDSPTTSRLSDPDFILFRNASCYTRCDDFVSVDNITRYGPIFKGYVSGWVHCFSKGGRRYAYWLHSAFVGSRGRGEIPRRIKTSVSRHEAYIGLVDYNAKVEAIRWTRPDRVRSPRFQQRKYKNE